MVVQAALKSGALISAKYALDQGKEVFAVPGSVFDELSLGCHALIRQGATTVSNSADILEVFGYDVEEKQQSIPLATKTTFAPESMEATILATCKLPSPFDEIQLKTGLSLLEWLLRLEGFCIFLPFIYTKTYHLSSFVRKQRILCQFLNVSGLGPDEIRALPIKG